MQDRDKIRNIFNQYSLLENKVTHALAHTFASEKVLLRKFLQWVTGQPPGIHPVITVQDREGEGDSVPDMTLEDESTCLAVENKLYQNSINTNQLWEHWKRTEASERPTRGVLVISPDSEEPEHVRQIRRKGAMVYWHRWPDVHRWIKETTGVRGRHGRSLVGDFCEFLRVAEDQLHEKGVNAMLTVFDGIHFEGDERDGIQAPSLLRHIRKFIEASDRMKQLFPGRKAELGRKQSGLYWTSIGLVPSSNGMGKDDPFNKHPHLTIEFEETAFLAFIVLPHAALTQYKQHVRQATLRDWQKLLMAIQEAVIGLADGGPPTAFLKIQQRHWKVRRGSPITDGELQFSLDTLADSSMKVDGRAKTNPAWASMLPELIAASKRVNTQLEIGLRYPYKECKEALGNPAFPEHLIESIGTLCPFFNLITQGI